MQKKDIEERFAAIAYLADELPLLDVLSDGCTVTTKKGRLVQVVHVAGIGDVELSSHKHLELKNIIKGFFNKLPVHLTISIHTRRQAVQIVNPGEDDVHLVVTEIVRRQELALQDSYVTQHFIVIEKELPALLKAVKGTSWKSILAWQQGLEGEAIKLSEEVKLLMGLLQDFRPENVTTIGQGVQSLYSFWSYLVNGGKEYAVPQSRAYLGKLLALNDIKFGKERGRVRLQDNEGERLAGVFAFNEYPDSTRIAFFDRLLQLSYPFSLVQYIAAVPEEEAKTLITKKMGALSAVEKGFNTGNLNNLYTAGDAIESGDMKLIHHSCSLFVYGNTEASLNEAITAISAEVNRLGMNLIPESFGLHSAWFAQFPDYHKARTLRAVLLASDHIAHFNSFLGTDTGNRFCDFGNHSVARFKTASNSYYHFNFHGMNDGKKEGNLGHTLVIGASGKGKTTLIIYLLLQCLKFKGWEGDRPLKMLLFDSGKGVKIPTLACGGTYSDIARLEGISLNPLLMPDTEENRAYLVSFISLLADGVSEEERKKVQQAVKDCYRLPAAERLLKNLDICFGKPGAVKDGRPGLRDRLEVWLNPKYPEYRLFNNEEDTLFSNSDNQMMAFDIAGILKEKRILAPVISYVFYSYMRFMERYPSPHVYFLDEIWNYLDHPDIAPFIDKVVLESRKKNGIIIGAVQSAAMLTRSQNGRTFIGNAATFLIFPNPSANAEDYSGEGRDTIGLTDKEFQWVKTCTEGYQVMMKRKGGGSVILNVDLSSLGSYLKLLSSQNSNVHKVEELIKQHGNEWVGHYLN